MTIKFQIYKCNVCGNLVQILQEGEGNLICCGEEMELMNVQYDSDEMGEKHAPKFEEREGKIFVSVKTHPMTNEHYIQFIEAFSKDKKELQLKFFEPSDIPDIELKLNGEAEAVEYCNIHHLWGNKKPDAQS
jgi:superoxide reductase